MIPKNIAAILAYLGASHIVKGSKWVSSTCPVAYWKHEGGKDSNSSFGVSFGGPVNVAHCFSCGLKVPIAELVHLVKHYSKTSKPAYLIQLKKAFEVLDLDSSEMPEIDLPDYEDYLAAKGTDSFTEFPEWWLGSFPKVDPHLPYLVDRHVDPAVVDFMDLRFDATRQRVCFPIRDYQGRLAGMTGRAINDNPLRYYDYPYSDKRNPMVLINEDKIDFDKTVVVTEGPFDVAAILQVTPNVVGLRGAPSAEKFKRLQMAECIAMAFDLGKGGDKARQMAMDLLGPKVYYDVLPEAEDFGSESLAHIAALFQSVKGL